MVLDGLNMANAALRGHGGIWVMHTPYLLFYPDENGDDVPDRDPEVRLAGFGLEDTHSVANGLAGDRTAGSTARKAARPRAASSGPASIRRTSRASITKAAWSGAIIRETKAYEIFAEGGGKSSNSNSTPRAGFFPATTAATRAAGITCRAGSS